MPPRKRANLRKSKNLRSQKPSTAPLNSEKPIAEIPPKKKPRTSLDSEVATLYRDIQCSLCGAESVDEAQLVAEDFERNLNLSGEGLSLTRSLLRERILNLQMKQLQCQIYDCLSSARDNAKKSEELGIRIETATYGVQNNVCEVLYSDIETPEDQTPSYGDKNREIWEGIEGLEREREELEKERVEIAAERQRLMKIYKERTHEIVAAREETRRVYADYSELLFFAGLGRSPALLPGLICFTT